MTLKDLPIGKTATVTVVGGEGALRQHFLDMGIIPMADVTMVKYAPMGDPVEVRIHSYELTLRLADAAQIQIDNVRDEKEQKRGSRVRAIPHPGLGEGGKYHETNSSMPDRNIICIVCICTKDKSSFTFVYPSTHSAGKTTYAE